MPEPSLSATQECHIWALPPEEDEVAQVCRKGWGLLCEKERLRYGAMSNPSAARRFLLGRSLLRMALSQHLGARPEDLRFARQPKGKPILIHPTTESLSFNLSHSDQETVVAIAQCSSLGIDLEALSRGASVLRIAERFFSPAERHQILSRPEESEITALRLWVLKESVTKALGNSIWDALSSISPNTTGRDLGWFLPPPAGSEENWALVLGSFRKRYVLAVALQSASGWNGKTIHFRNHVLGQSTTESLLFSPEMKSRSPTVRQAVL